MPSVPGPASPTSAVSGGVCRYDHNSILEQLEGVPDLNADQREVFNAAVAAAEDKRQNVNSFFFAITSQLTL